MRVLIHVCGGEIDFNWFLDCSLVLSEAVWTHGISCFSLKKMRKYSASRCKY